VNHDTAAAPPGDDDRPLTFADLEDGIREMGWTDEQVEGKGRFRGLLLNVELPVRPRNEGERP
jgi:hypothetical protein